MCSLFGSGGGDPLAVAGEGGEDLVGGLDPDVGSGVLVPGGDPISDVAFEGPDAGVGAAADLLGREFGEPPLDQVEPRPGGRREVEMEAGMAQQPALDVGRLVSGVV